MGSDDDWYRDLRVRLASINAFDRDLLGSISLLIAPIAVYAISLSIFSLHTGVSIVFANAVLLAFSSVQLGFIMHEAGHGALFAQRRVNDMVGLLVGDLLTGLSYGWWVKNHNGHHAHPNVDNVDPDLAMIRIVFALSPAELQRAGVFRRFFGYSQASIAPLLFTLQIFGLKYFGLRHVLSTRSKQSTVEVLLIALHHLAYFAFLFHFLGWRLGIGVAMMHHLVAGFYLTTVVSTNHIARPILAACESNPVLRQAGQSRNIRTPAGIEFMWGGLNHQIEHHLFPTIRRDHIRDALPIVRNFCSERNIPYHETTLTGCYREIFGLLSSVSANGRAR